MINGKPIALLFGEKGSFWDPFSIEFKIGQIFGKMASPIALLFGEKWSFWDPFSIEFKIWRMFELDNIWENEYGQYLGKWQAYSLTFW